MAAAPGTLTAHPAIAAWLNSTGVAYRVLDRDAYMLVRADLCALTALVQWADLRHVAVESGASVLV